MQVLHIFKINSSLYVPRAHRPHEQINVIHTIMAFKETLYAFKFTLKLS